MSGPFVPGVGAVLSADIAVPDHARVVHFYSRVLGTGAAPLWREDLMNNLGLPIIGLGMRTEAYADLPLQWMPHIQVADVARSAARAVEGDGRELMHHRDDQGESQWAVLMDPFGAAFGIIPVVPAEHIPPVPSASHEGDAEHGAGTNGPAVGSIRWVDLTVSDATAARDFYARVIGWQAEELVMGEGPDRYADYLLRGESDDARAGVCHARGVNAGLPPVWLLYLPVGDLDESLERVGAEGGRILHEQRGKDGALRYAVIEDPVGAAVALVPG
jgi:uncharacterized protein